MFDKWKEQSFWNIFMFVFSPPLLWISITMDLIQFNLPLNISYCSTAMLYIVRPPILLNLAFNIKWRQKKSSSVTWIWHNTQPTLILTCNLHHKLVIICCQVGSVRRLWRPALAEEEEDNLVEIRLIRAGWKSTQGEKKTALMCKYIYCYKQWTLK